MSHPIPEGETTPQRRTNFPSRWLFFLCIVGIAGAFVAYTRWQYNRPESSYERGREALNAGDDEIVLRESKRLIGAKGYEPQGHLLMGLMLTRRGKLAEAVDQLSQAGSRSTSVEACTVAAKCLYGLGRYLEAIDAAHAALELDTNAVDARRWLAATYYDLGAVSNAVVELTLLSKQAPKDPGPDRLLGLIAKDNKNFQNAIDHYRESLRRDPNQPERESILDELAESQIQLNSFEGAQLTLRECRRSARVLTMEAECLYGLGRFGESLDLLRDAITLDPRYFLAKLTQGRLLMDMGQAEQASLVLEDAVRIEPLNSQAHFQLSQALRATGKVDQAAAELLRMTEIQAIEREFGELHETATLHPSDAQIRRRLGELALQLGKPELAKVWFRAALAIDPNHVPDKNGVPLASPVPPRTNQ